MTPPLHPPDRQPDDRDVFVSYTTRDEEVEAAAEMADQLNAALKAEGIGATVRRRIWWDKDEIGSFEGSSGRLAQVLRAGIVSARCLVSIQSATYRQSPWCRFECDSARVFGVKTIDATRDQLTSPSGLERLIETIRVAVKTHVPSDPLDTRDNAPPDLIPISSEEALVACALGAAWSRDLEARSFWTHALQQVEIKGWRRPRIVFRDFVASHFGYHLVPGAALLGLRDDEVLMRRETDPDFYGPCWTDRFFGRGALTGIRDVLAFDAGPLKKMRPHIEDMI